MESRTRMTETPGTRPRRVEILETLRGLAALAVAWHHITSNDAFRWLNLMELGGLGVPIFFCISGFILPYAMHTGGFRWPQDGRCFILKRVLRLDPPYLATILLCLAAEYAATQAPGYQGRAFRYSAGDLLGHIAYMNSLWGCKWVNPVFWTLAIEFQYYLFVACLFPLLVLRHPLSRTLALAGMLASSPCFGFHYVFHHLPLFVIGIASFQRYCGISSRLEWSCVVLISAVVGGYVSGIPDALAAVGCTLTIVLWPATAVPPGALQYLGRISYSLYLVHFPIGCRLRNIGARVVGDSAPGQVVVALVSLAVSVLVAHGMWRLIEKPSQAWASRLRYGSVPEPTVNSAITEPPVC